MQIVEQICLNRSFFSRYSPLLAHKHDEQLPESDLLLMANLLEDWLK